MLPVTRSLIEAVCCSPDCPAFNAAASGFRRIPGHPIAYWLKSESLDAFERLSSVGAIAKPRQGTSTNDNARFVRKWFEVSVANIGFRCPSLEATVATGLKWFPDNKGGEFRKWYGNAELVVNWANDGQEIKQWLLNNPKDPNTDSLVSPYHRYRVRPCKPGLTWTFVSSSAFGIRYTDEGFLFDVGGSSLFPGLQDLPGAESSMLNGHVAFLKGVESHAQFSGR